MNKIWVPVSAQVAQAKKIDSIANNIANANTEGFKKDKVVFEEHLTALTKDAEVIDLPRNTWAPEDFYRTQGAENSFVKTSGSYTDFSQGALTQTANPLDVALKGPGFLKVNTPQGIKLTRSASLTINSAGTLVTTQGYPVVHENEDGSPEQIKVNNPKFINITEEGKLYSDAGELGQIKIIELRDPHALRKTGENLYVNNHPDNEIANESTVLKQGFKEGSNVNAIEEMAELIKAHRHFENIQKAIKVYDSITGNSVNDISNF